MTRLITLALLLSTALPALPASFHYQDPACTSFRFEGSGDSFTIVCQKDGGGGTTPPPVCNPTASTVPTPITNAGGTVNLDATCAPSTGVTYSWTRTAPTAGVPANAASATSIDTLAANTGATPRTHTWQVVACTAPASCDTKSVSTTVPGGGAIACAGFPEGTIVVDLPWTTNATLYTKNYGGFKGQGAMVLRFTVPLGAPPSTYPGQISMNEYAEPQTSRYAVFSKTACDFSGDYGNNLPAKRTGQGVSYSYTVSSVQPAQITVVPGTTYYINLRNTNINGGWSCFHPTCNMIINWFVPRSAAASKKKSSRPSK